jgi:molybdopterin converting factor small subunit
MSEDLLITIRFGEPYWRTTGQRDLQMRMPVGSCLQDLMISLFSRFPSLEQEMVEATPAIFVGDSEAEPDSPLDSGDHVHFLWPIAGG